MNIKKKYFQDYQMLNNNHKYLSLLLQYYRFFLWNNNLNNTNNVHLHQNLKNLVMMLVNKFTFLIRIIL